MTDDKSSFTIFCIYNVLFTNNIACNAINNGLKQLEQSSLYEFKTKMAANNVSRLEKKYESDISKKISNHSYLKKVNKILGEYVNKHIEILYWSLKGEFDRHKIDNSALLARLELARTLVSFSVVNLKTRIKELYAHGINGSRIDYLAMDGILKQIDNLMRTFDIPCEVDMNTPACKTSIDIIGRCLCNAALIAKVIKE